MQTDKDLFNLLKESYPLQPRQEFVTSTENLLKQRARKKTKRHMMKRLSFVSSGFVLCVLAFSWFFSFSGKDIVLDTLTSLGENETKTQDENIQTIEAVLQNALTGPSKELNQILDQTDWIEPLRQYEEGLYREYFANDSAYLDFVNSYGSVLMIEPRRNGYQLKVGKIDYEKIDAKDMVYNFTVELQYQKEGSEESKVAMVNGQANLTEEHKIEGMVIRMNDFLGSLINER
ncbi:hypothetical protein [Neobacillus niacini]|uniref:hypothetical protein n=1 Tax=Neobacillus niacini TaxID=86668 RepID=UPI001C8E5C39|nr:hypothetical protein [Neobacillus niacini]MBY0147882.1 hypothetical protein [Neobacillus niacini]